MSLRSGKSYEMSQSNVTSIPQSVTSAPLTSVTTIPYSVTSTQGVTMESEQQMTAVTIYPGNTAQSQMQYQSPRQPHNMQYHSRYPGPQSQSPPYPNYNFSPQLRSSAPMPDMHTEFETMYKRLEALLNSKIDGLKQYIDDALEEKFEDLKKYVDNEISRVESRVQDIETFVTAAKDDKEKSTVFDPDTTIIADNLPFDDDEDLDKKAQDMIRKDLALNIRVVRTTRLNPRPPRHTRQGTVSKPGLVKIQVPSLDDKIKILRNKRMLENTVDYKQVFLRSSKCHTDRLMETNFRTVLEMIDTRKEYKLTANGHIVKKQNQPASDAAAPNAPLSLA